MRLKRRRSGGRWKRERGMWGVDKNRREEGIDGMHLRSSERLANLSGTLNHPNIRLCIASQAKRKVYGDRPLYFIHISFHPVVTNFGGIFLHSTVTIISRNCFLDLSWISLVGHIYFKLQLSPVNNMSFRFFQIFP